MRLNVLQRGLGVFLLLAVLGAGLVSPAMTRAQDATATPIAGLPEGPLGEQMQWLVDYLNMPEAEAASVDLSTIFSSGVLADVPADQLQQILSNIRTDLAPVTVDTETMVTSKDLPPTVANFNLTGPDGTQLPTSLSVDSSSGLISSIWFSSPIAPAATTVPTETAVATETVAPTETATLAPTETATTVPTETPTTAPTQTATLAPTETETPVPTATATLEPTETPTTAPTQTATLEPTDTPTTVPTDTATLEPTETPTLEPTETATLEPTNTATLEPTETTAPTETATTAPTETATAAPTETATEVPTLAATATATEEAASPIAVEETTEASPIASPVASDFPAGPLGEQAAWTWSILSNQGESVTAEELEQHLSPEFLAQAPADLVSATLAELQTAYGPFTLDTTAMIVSANEPPTVLSYGIVGQDGTRFHVGVQIDPSNGLINGFTVAPDAASATPVAITVPAGLTDTEVSFTSGGDTIYGSYLAPEGTQTDSPAALIISGSGPTDRNGNNSGLSMNTNLNLAITLAQAGIPSLRYDKIGTGETGLGSHADGSGIDFELYLQQARDAADFLAAQPGVDPSKLILVGHSEGALFALALADELSKAGTPPAGLILAAPLSIRYLDLLQTQIAAQAKAAVAAQSMTDADAEALLTELSSIIESIRSTGELAAPVTNPQLAQIFSAQNIPFLAQADKLDPAEIAAGLPTDMPVLVLLGYKDAQVTADEVRELFYGFRDAGNDNVTLASLPNADHTLRIVEGDANPSVDYANPDLQFSPEAVTAIDAFLEKYGLSESAS